MHDRISAGSSLTPSRFREHSEALIQLLQIDLALARELSDLTTILSLEFGEKIPTDAFYLIQSGRVRLVSCDRQQQDVSVGVLEAGEGFGQDKMFCETAIEYGAIATSDVCLIRVENLTLWLDRLPQWRKIWSDQAATREQLIFLKTQTNLSSLRSLTSTHIQQLLPLLNPISIPAGTLLAQSNANQGLCWLRSGEIEAPHESVQTWGTTEIPADLRAKTALTVYQLPSSVWESAIAIAPPLGKILSRDSNSAVKPVSMAKSRVTPTIAQAKSVESANVESAASIVEFPQPVRSRWRFRLGARYPYIQQQSSSDCGVACLAMVTQYWGKRLSLNVLRNLAKVGRNGATLKNLADAAETIGFQARPVRASLGRLRDQQPWIAHWQGDHYVVVYQVKGHRVLIADPAKGKRSITEKDFLSQWTGYALLLTPTPDLKAIDHQEERSIFRFGQILWSYRPTLVQIVLLSLLIQIFGLITPLFTQVILDRVVTERSLTALNVFAIGLLLFSVWRVGLMAVRRYLLDYFSNRLDLTLLSGFVGHALKLPLKFFEDRQVGDVITRVQENQKVQMFLVRQLISTWLDATMAIVYLALMFYYNWQLTLLVVTLIPPLVLLAAIATPLLRRISRENFNDTSEQNSQLVEMMTGIATVKAMAAERDVRWRWEDRLTTMLNSQFRAQKLANSVQSVGGLISTLGSTALLWYGAYLVIQGELTIGQFVAFNLLIGSVINPILAIVDFWDELQEVVISVERLNDVFATAPEESSKRLMLVMPPIRGEIQFENVTFRYEDVDDRNTLQNLAFSIEAGETIAIVGRSGSGKSTLVKLIQGLYQPNNGRVLIDGHDVRHVSPPTMRSQLGVVPQDCFLFSGTILENIQLYRPEYGLEQVIEAAKLAEANGFIQDLPLGYNTKVGERGANLSGGQRQRIAIARALLGDPAILILDEATSSLDTESERRFQQNLRRISRGRTTLIIAHRLSTVRHADRILVLDKGVLVEIGTHEELLSQQRLYHHLTQQQLALT
ncbi:ABC transporter transmembrane domain-containing protein [Leptolyngbya sp. NIES-2104]|uniref:ABC transporter transmembrane domain-containing protein n=1 Tax=Leptolyngbya sp. NIES-2104 TaxID=1552121 RepID=UPI0006ECB606|nr:ABC transporter transmembrane domain-containing protein [Leptolyngbya sp. NIES-2104]GAP93672.1 heterocyst differentiation protein [Leptolyngbya sp. NIES-2104]